MYQSASRFTVIVVIFRDSNIPPVTRLNKYSISDLKATATSQHFDFKYISVTSFETVTLSKLVASSKGS